MIVTGIEEQTKTKFKVYRHKSRAAFEDEV